MRKKDFIQGLPCRIHGKTLLRWTPSPAQSKNPVFKLRERKRPLTATEAVRATSGQAGPSPTHAKQQKRESMGAVGDDRADFPILQPKTRGCLSSAIAIASDPSKLAVAKADLTNRFYAANSWKTVQSHDNSVAAIATAAGIDIRKPNQVNANSILTVAAALHAAGYRSAQAYMGSLKRLQAENDEKQGPAVSRLYKKIDDALTRGIGPPDKAPEILIGDMKRDTELYTCGPVLGGPDHYTVCHAYLLREIESSAILADKSQISLKSNGDAALTLPVSKTDTTGRSCTRALSCICYMGTFQNTVASDACGPCAIRRQLLRLLHAFEYEWEADNAEKMRLFPHTSGRTAKKEEVIGTWTICSASMNVPKGHSARRSGAKSLARCGWSLWQIQTLARHTSDAILGYVEEAISELSCEWNRNPGSSSSCSHDNQSTANAASISTYNPERIQKVENALAELQTKLKECQHKQLKIAALQRDEAAGSQEWKNMIAMQLSGLDSKVMALADSADTEWLAVSESYSQAWGTGDRHHIVEKNSLELAKPWWTTKCGWRFGTAKNVKLLPHGLREVSTKPCAKCYKIGQPAQ